ncbi:MAG: DNA-methyltransferase [Candidatus Thorarchaeota archaeon]
MKDYINKIILGNCIEIFKDFKDNSIDIMLTDPPNLVLTNYFSTRTFFSRNFGDLGIVEWFWKEFFKELKRIIKDDGFFFIFCNEDSYPIFWYYCYQFTKKVRQIIWDKTVSINGYYFRHQYESILFGIMENSPIIPTGDGDILSCRAVPVKKRIHPSQKPVKLVEQLLLKVSNENDIILDPFLGSGTTIKACIRNKRRYIGIEYGKEYYDLALKEIENIKIQEGMF